MVAGRVTKTNLLVRLCSDESGASAIELALVTTFLLVPLLLGGTEIGRRAWTKSQIENAARAGLEYAFTNVRTTNCAISSANSTKINNAAATATSLTVTASSCTFCGCPTSSGVTGQGNGSTCSNGMANGSTCSDGMAAGDYVTVTAKTTYTPLFSSCTWIGAPSKFCSVIPLSSTMTARLD
jgi:Flp pilus assembly protein TadG